MGRIQSKVITSQAAGTINVAAAAATGKHHELVGYHIGLATAGTLKFVSDAAGTPAELMGAIPMAANAPSPPNRFPAPLPAGSAKTLDLITTVGVTAGVVWFTTEDD